MARMTIKQAEEYFVKLQCDAYNKEELAREIWRRMDADEREPYFKELEDE